MPGILFTIVCLTRKSGEQKKRERSRTHCLGVEREHARQRRQFFKNSARASARGSTALLLSQSISEHVIKRKRTYSGLENAMVVCFSRQWDTSDFLDTC